MFHEHLLYASHCALGIDCLINLHNNPMRWYYYDDPHFTEEETGTEKSNLPIVQEVSGQDPHPGGPTQSRTPNHYAPLSPTPSGMA